MILPKIISGSKSASKAIGFIAIVSTAVCGWLLGVVITFEYLTHPGLQNSASPEAVTELTPAAPEKVSEFSADQWRYTTQGWQNINHWSANETQASDLSISQFHPLTFAAILVMVSVLAMVLTSTDQEVDRLLNRYRH